MRKMPFETSAPILERFAPTEEALALIAADAAPAETVALLYKQEKLADMVSFFAYGMPPREGVCWAIAVHKDVAQALGRELLPDVRALLDLASYWVRDPQEGRRVQLMQAGENLNSSNPVSWLCNAVAWNGSGSMGPVDGPVVLPPAGLHASALLGAVALLAGDTAEGFKAVLNSAYRRGLEVAEGGWPRLDATQPERV